MTHKEYGMSKLLRLPPKTENGAMNLETIEVLDF